MKITDIKPQVKRADRVSIFIDKRYSFSLSTSELLNTGLRKGQEIDEAELNALRKQATLSKALTRSYHLLSYRARSEWEISSYLIRHEYDKDTISNVIDQLRKSGYINDLSFATEWVKNRSAIKNSSARKLRLELAQKHIDRETIAEAVKLADIDERDKLKILIEKMRRQNKYEDNLKLMQYLSRQGYNYDDIKTVLGSTDW